MRSAVTGTMRVRTPRLKLAGVNQWALVAVEDFSKPQSLLRKGWSSDKTADCGLSGDTFLGGYCHFADTKVSKTFHRLPVHTHLRLQARMHFFDKWEGQYAYIMVNDRVVWIHNHRHCRSIFQSGCRGVNVCGDEGYADRLSMGVDVVVTHDNRARHPQLPPIELRVMDLVPGYPLHKRNAIVPKPTLDSTPAQSNRWVDVEQLPEEKSAGKGKGKGGKGQAKKGKDGKPLPTLKPFVPNFNNTDTVTITFGAVMPFGDPCVASWGVDDVQLYAMFNPTTAV